MTTPFKTVILIPQGGRRISDYFPRRSATEMVREVSFALRDQDNKKGEKHFG
jgi:hypothetical protein